jgi:hypothetical protein
VLEDDREDSIDCRGREVSILGSRNTLRLRGSCPMVIMTGSDNELDVDASQRIRATGDSQPRRLDHRDRRRDDATCGEHGSAEPHQ